MCTDTRDLETALSKSGAQILLTCSSVVPLLSILKIWGCWVFLQPRGPAALNWFGFKIAQPFQAWEAVCEVLTGS